jgi:hypothetical protein
MASDTEPNTIGLAGATPSQNGRVRTAAGGQSGQGVDQEETGHLARGQPELVPVPQGHERRAALIDSYLII